MNCRKHASLLSAYIDDKLADTELATEIDECSDCRHSLRLLARSRAILSSAGSAEPASDLAARVTRAALASDASERRPSLLDGWFTIAWPSAGLAAAAAALLLFLSLGSPGATGVAGDNSGDPLGVLVVGDGDYDVADEVLALEVEP